MELKTSGCLTSNLLFFMTAVPISMQGLIKKNFLHIRVWRTVLFVNNLLLNSFINLFFVSVPPLQQRLLHGTQVLNSTDSLGACISDENALVVSGSHVLTGAPLNSN